MAQLVFQVWKVKEKRDSEREMVSEASSGEGYNAAENEPPLPFPAGRASATEGEAGVCEDAENKAHGSSK